MEKKQTALDWLLDRIIENNNLPEIHLSLFDILKAKEMEKRQITDAYHAGIEDVIPYNYFDNTFKNNENEKQQ